MEQIKEVEIQDKVFEETYIANIQNNGNNWIGWIPDVPKVKCEASTEAVLLKTLEKNYMRHSLLKKKLGRSSLRRM